MSAYYHLPVCECLLPPPCVRVPATTSLYASAYYHLPVCECLPTTRSDCEGGVWGMMSFAPLVAIATPCWWGSPLLTPRASRTPTRSSSATSTTFPHESTTLLDSSPNAVFRSPSSSTDGRESGSHGGGPAPSEMSRDGSRCPSIPGGRRHTYRLAFGHTAQTAHCLPGLKANREAT